MAPAKKSSSAKAPAKKSQYEIERDERIKRNEEYRLSIVNPYGSPRLAGETIAPERLTYDWSDNEGPKRRSQSSRRARVRVVDELTDEQRAALEGFNMDDFEAYERRRPL